MIQNAHGWIHPNDIINANEGLHRMQVAERRGRLRQIGRVVFGRQLVPVQERTRVIVTMGLLERRKRDAANWAPTAKPLIDGLTDARIWPDDEDAWVVGPDMRLGPLSSDRSGPVAMRRVEVWITLSPAVESVEPVFESLF
jgi:crossover junction endodeoxyribonuclease RusA